MIFYTIKLASAGYRQRTRISFEMTKGYLALRGEGDDWSSRSTSLPTARPWRIPRALDRPETAAACKIIWAVVMPWLRVNGKEHYQMAKAKQQKHDVAETKAASSKMKRKEFEKELANLQVELTQLQTWVQAKGARVIVVFEGRDAA